jgi:nitrite reductase/ring-hydroxylating ferredoxin subunit
LRTANHEGQELLIIGGNGHDVGRPPKPPSELVQDLISWTQRRFPDAAHTHTWSAQDYRSPSGVPFIGRLPRGGGQVYLATGFSKWGMTNASMAALMISGEILGDPPSWARHLGHRVSRPSVAAKVVGFNAKVGVYATTGWLGAELHQQHGDGQTPAEGEGVVQSRLGRPVAVSTVDGQTCELNAVCTHLGGIVAWNDLERSWDCPLHGSRFAPDGTVLEGPATSPLATVKASAQAQQGDVSDR